MIIRPKTYGKYNDGSTYSAGGSRYTKPTSSGTHTTSNSNSAYQKYLKAHEYYLQQHSNVAHRRTTGGAPITSTSSTSSRQSPFAGLSSIFENLTSNELIIIGIAIIAVMTIIAVVLIHG